MPVVCFTGGTAENLLIVPLQYSGTGTSSEGDSSASATVSASVTGANATSTSEISLTANPAGQAVMQSAFIIVDGILGNSAAGCDYAAIAWCAGSSTVRATLLTERASELAQVRIDIHWVSGTASTAPVQIARNMGATITFGGNQLTIGTDRTGFLFANGTTADGQQFTTMSSAPLNSLTGSLGVSLGQFAAYVPNQAAGSIVINRLSEGLVQTALDRSTPNSLQAGSIFSGTLELWAGSGGTAPQPVPAPPPTPPPTPVPAP
jgi:hypothetical protein